MQEHASHARSRHARCRHVSMHGAPWKRPSPRLSGIQLRAESKKGMKQIK